METPNLSQTTLFTRFLEGGLRAHEKKCEKNSMET